jgi:16S rRNA pseudouridine516 synthase
MKIVKLLANLGYGSRRDVTQMLKNDWITRRNGASFGPNDEVTSADYADILIDDQPMDSPEGMVLMLNKSVGYTCSTKDLPPLVYELLPPRFRLRRPILSSVGRLDRDTSGLLLMTDDGPLLHRITSPKSNLPKVYEAVIAEPLRGDEAAQFASGSLMLESETEPLAAATLEVIEPLRVRITTIEGRYHQVRRMFAAVSNHVHSLHRVSIGGLDLGDLASGQWRLLGESDMEKLFSGSPRG